METTTEITTDMEITTTEIIILVGTSMVIEMIIIIEKITMEIIIEIITIAIITIMEAHLNKCQTIMKSFGKMVHVIQSKLIM